MAESFQFVLYPYDEYLQSAQDEFLVGHFRFFLQGNNVELVCEMPASTRAKEEGRELANRYAGLLRKYLGVLLRALTHEELGQMLPQDISLTGLGHQGSKRLFLAIRKARNELLAEGDLTLRRCDDYLQDAREQEKGTFFSLYKAIEVIKKEFGGWKEASSALRTGSEIQFVKRLANEAKRDERHAPGAKDVVRRPDQADNDQAIECTTRILRAYEECLRPGALNPGYHQRTSVASG